LDSKDNKNVSWRTGVLNLNDLIVKRSYE